MKNYKAGHIISQGTYKVFIPTRINRDWHINNMEVIALLSRADR